ncbi:MAG: DUF2238 domain-containing protein [Xanthomonadales bacterium]|nr:DUF2238 domain-containing protein [Xanthomonadales bacterium]
MSRDLVPIAAFNGAYLLAAAAWVLSEGNFEFLAYIAVMVLLALAVLAVHRRIGLPLALLWCLSAWGLAHMAGGLVFVPDGWPTGGGSRVLYNWWLVPGWLKFDQLVHAWGFGVTTWLCWEGLRSILAARGPVPRPTVGMLALCAAAGMGFGALNEVVEFVVTLLVPDNNVGGYFNTAMDLVFNLLGALVAAVLIRWRWRPA